MDPQRFYEQELNDLHPNDVEMLQPAAESPSDSDYFSEGEGDSPVNACANGDHISMDSVDFSISEDWIELDLSRNSPRSLGFLSGRPNVAFVFPLVANFLFTNRYGFPSRFRVFR